MMCETLNKSALTELPDGFHFRNCRRDELDIWKAMPFDDSETAEQYHGYMTEFFNNVYGDKEDLFYDKCVFVCDENDRPVGTCFVWKAYDAVMTVHWWKVLKDYENRGIGRALLSYVMSEVSDGGFPVYLHTQPESYRAIKLYSDFGFSFLTDEIIGDRKNDLHESIPFLKEMIPEEYFKFFTYATAPESFIEAVKSSSINQF